MASFILRWFIFQRGGFLHSAGAAVGMTERGTFLCYRKQFRPFGCGTARRPFPTFSLVGGFFHPHRLYLLCCLAMDHRRYIAWFRSSTRVLFAMFPTVSLIRSFLQPRSSFDRKKAWPQSFTGHALRFLLAIYRNACYSVLGATSTPVGGSPGFFRG